MRFLPGGSQQPTMRRIRSGRPTPGLSVSSPKVSSRKSPYRVDLPRRSMTLLRAEAAVGAEMT